MKTNVNEKETNLKKENEELLVALKSAAVLCNDCKRALDLSKWLNKMYKSVLTEGKFEVQDEEELYRSLFVTGMTNKSKEEVLKQFNSLCLEYGERMKITFTFNKKWQMSFDKYFDFD